MKKSINSGHSLTNYLVIFPNERAQEVYDILGPQMDSAYNLQHTFDQVQANLSTKKTLNFLCVVQPGLDHG
jgi:hypothetical protein